jgi:hypothetical protein
LAIPDARTVQLVYPDGGSDTVRVTADRFYVGEVPQGHLLAVHRHGLLLVARDAEGRQIGQAVVRHDAITPPSEARRPHDPIELDTISDESDLTQLLGVRGDVRIPGAVRVRLRYPDQTTTQTATLKDGRFRFDIPVARQGDFATRPGTIEALGADGRSLRQQPVASVAYWHRRNGG